MSDEAAIARIEGKVDLINDRHSRFIEDVRDINLRVGKHGDRLNELERDSNIQKGERKGSQRMLTIMYGVASVMGVSGTVAIIKVLIGH